MDVLCDSVVHVCVVPLIKNDEGDRDDDDDDENWIIRLFYCLLYYILPLKFLFCFY